MTERAEWSLSSMLILVSDLDRSINFYTDVCGLQEIVHESDAALLGDELTGSIAVDLRQADGGGVRAGRQALGLRACSFFVGPSTELDRVEARLQALSAFQDRQQRGEDGRIGVVRGHDPDRLPLAFLSYERPLTAAEHRGAFPLIYGWDS